MTGTDPDTATDPDPGADDPTDEEPKLRVSKIRDGTVIDHVTAGQALNVLAILGIDGTGGESVSIGMNVPSDRLARKDVVKVEGRELSPAEVDVLSLIAPEATINIIREYEVVRKTRVQRPDAVVGVIECPNHSCITNAGEPVESEFDVVDEGLRCRYCETILQDGIADQIRA